MVAFWDKFALEWQDQESHVVRYAIDWLKTSEPAARVAFCALSGILCVAAATKTPEPRITSVTPAIATPGTAVTLRFRGAMLQTAHGIWSSFADVTTASVRYVEDSKTPGEGYLQADLAIAPAAASGRHTIRVITTSGLSNELPFEIITERVHSEQDIDKIRGAAVIAGVLSVPGETDTYWIDAAAGETWSFAAKAAAPGLDPALAIYVRSGSWFDEARMNRLASNDEPLHFPGLSSDASLTWRFEKAGRYAVVVSGFAGQGGPDAAYVLRAQRGTLPDPLLHPVPGKWWEERQFTRTLGARWLSDVAARAADSNAPGQVEMWDAVSATASELPVVAVPGLIRGRIDAPARTQAVSLRIEKPEHLVIEVETPRATMPRFNPVVRLLDASGHEMVTNVYTKRNNNGLYMMKMIQAKSTVVLRSPGVYRLEVRDITTDCAGEDFEFKVLVRRAVPHIGKVVVNENQVNLRPQSVAEVHVTADREEDFAGTVAFEVEGLPAGVSLLSGIANPVEKPPLPNGGRVERYTPRTQSSVLLLSAAGDAPATPQPVTIRIFARPVTDARLGSRLLVREMLLFVVSGSS